MSDDIIRQIDAAVRANLCACGCGEQIPARGPSPDFVNEKHQQQWQQTRSQPPRTAVPQEWLDRLNDRITTAAEGDTCDDPACRCCHIPAADPGETPMARVVRETSSLRRAIDKIMGKSR